LGILRTIFALAVVFAHLPLCGGLVFVGGRNAVQLFYIISGFLISYVLTERGGYSNFSTFYLSRWLRLYPIYFVILCLTFLVYLAENSDFFNLYRNIPLAADIALVTVNSFLFGQDWIMFSGVENGSLTFMADFTKSDFQLWRGLLVPQAWTLGVEMSFYLIAPFVLPRRRLTVALLLCSLSLRGILIYEGFGGHDPWTYRFFPNELAFFLIGSLVHQILLPLYKKMLGARIESLSCVATCILILCSVFYFVVPVSSVYKTSVLFLFFILFLPLTFIFQNKNGLDRKIGDLSYPIYIGHFLVIYLTDIYFKRLGISDELVITIASVVLSVVLAVGLNRIIGDRVESMRGKLKRRAVKKIDPLPDESMDQLEIGPAQILSRQK